MRITEMARMSTNSYQMKTRANQPLLPNNPSMPRGHVNPYEDPHMNITGKSPSEWQKTVPVDEKVADKLRSLIREDFVERYGMCGYGSQADAQASIIKSYTATLPGEQRLAASWSCEQIALKEADRLSAKIREQNPNWQYGDYFDPSILEEAEGLDIRA